MINDVHIKVLNYTECDTNSSTVHTDGNREIFSFLIGQFVSGKQVPEQQDSLSMPINLLLHVICTNASGGNLSPAIQIA